VAAVTVHDPELAHMSEAELLERAGQALRRFAAAAPGTAARERADARYRRLSLELSWRSVDRTLAAIDTAEEAEAIGRAGQ
jgi:hypothetical protein